MELPVASPFFLAEMVSIKAAVVREWCGHAGRMVAFAGDGFPDLPAVRSRSRPLAFSRGDLAVALAVRERPLPAVHALGGCRAWSAPCRRGSRA